MGCSTQPLRPGTGTRRPAALPIPQWWRRAATALPGIPASAASAPVELEGPRSSSSWSHSASSRPMPPAAALRREDGHQGCTRAMRRDVAPELSYCILPGVCSIAAAIQAKCMAPRFIGTVCGMLDARFVLPGSNASASSLCGICRGKTLWSIRLLACLLRNLIGITSSFAGKLLDYATFKVLSSASATH